MNEVYDEMPNAIPALNILTLIRRGQQVVLDDEIINGNLDFTQLDIGRLPDGKIPISASIMITNSLILGDIIFEDANFLQSIDFRGSVICGKASFARSIFMQPCHFNGAHFLREFILNNAIFNCIASVDFSNAEFLLYTECFGVIFPRSALFRDSLFIGDVQFSGSAFVGISDFTGTRFRDRTDLRHQTQSTCFRKLVFCKETYFRNTIFDHHTDFIEAQFKNEANFEGTAFKSATFAEATFEGKTDFSKVTFNNDGNFRATIFKGEYLKFNKTFFEKASDQELACRKAKIVLEKAGDRDGADYHFYREMEAKRKQKGIDKQYFDFECLLFSDVDYEEINYKEIKKFRKYLIHEGLEYLIFQVVFGYGVHPLRLWTCWFIFVGIFAAIYWIGKGVNNATTLQPLDNLTEYIWFSITVAVTPGFAGNKPAVGIYQLIAGLEAIFGTFMWAAFITTFGKKYMR